jgi:hypothetical protein
MARQISSASHDFELTAMSFKIGASSPIVMEYNKRLKRSWRLSLYSDCENRILMRFSNSLNIVHRAAKQLKRTLCSHTIDVVVGERK